MGLQCLDKIVGENEQGNGIKPSLYLTHVLYFMLGCFPFVLPLIFHAREQCVFRLAVNRTVHSCPLLPYQREVRAVSRLI